jgi:DNA adenine methylase
MEQLHLLGERGLPPVFKWAGGKRRLLRSLLPYTSHIPGVYFEPFLGSGALFFALAPARAVLADSNAELINFYVQLQCRPDSVIKELRKFRNTAADYYRIRNKDNGARSQRAARFLYLTTLAFNGIYRLNIKGKFNVPYGQKKHVKVCDSGRLRKAAEILHSAVIKCGDFEETVKGAGKGDLVYFDPPYTVAHGNNGFVKYNSKIFSWKDQVRLASLARKLAGRGCRVVISNADHESIRGLYSGFGCDIITRHSVMAADSDYRRPVTECIFFKGDD